MILILVLVAALVGQADPQGTCTVDDQIKTDCGYPGISERQCVDNNCCWEQVPGRPWCYNKGTLTFDECTIGTFVRVDCGYAGITERVCLANSSCCWQTLPSIPGVSIPHCYRKISVGVTEIEIFGRNIRLPDFEGCRISTIIRDARDIVQGFIDIAKSSSIADAILNILSNAEIFSIRSYCGLFFLTVDAVTGCPKPFVDTFALIFPQVNTTFYKALNALQSIKRPCQILSGQGLAASTPQCIPIAAELCPVNTVDILTAFTTFEDDIDASCVSLTSVLRGVVTCIDSATGGCPQAQRDSFQTLKDVYNRIADEGDTYCRTGCYDLIMFIADKHATCTWNLPRIYPDPSIENYCEYAHFAVNCGWTLWQGCPILPEEYFQKAMSVVEIALDLGGCNPVSLDNYIRNPAFQIELPPCVQASTDCARDLSKIVGIDTLMGEYGGYTVTNVQSKINEIGENLRTGNYKDFCGTPEQLEARRNPVRDCLDNLVDNCAPDTSIQAATLSYTAADWYDEACSPGCYELGNRLTDFRRLCNVNIDIDIANIPINLILGQFAAVGNDAPECMFVKEYAACVSFLMSNCTFLHNRIQDARQLIVDAILGPDTPETDIYVCGVKIDYPIRIQGGGHAIIQVGSVASKIFLGEWTVGLLVLISLLKLL